MRTLRSRSLMLGWLAAGAAIGGLVVGGAWFASSHTLAAGLFDTPVAQGARADQPVPRYPAGPTPTIVPGIAQYPAPSANPAQTNSRRPSGEVTEVSASPAAFKIRTTGGEEMTFEVLTTTVFLAGRDRPYRFELLKPGDLVTVRDGPDKVPVPNASPVPAGGKAKGTTVHTSIGPRPPAGELVARQVIVRPAGESPKPGGKKQQAQIQTGGSDAAGQ